MSDLADLIVFLDAMEFGTSESDCASSNNVSQSEIKVS